MAHNVVYTFGNFRFKMAERVLESAGQRISITPKALELLIALVENRGRIVEKDDLMKKVWPETFVEENNLAFNISPLRKILRDGGSQEHTSKRFPIGAIVLSRTWLS